MTAATSSEQAHDKKCLLFTIPVELQLSICELVVLEDQPLLLNCPCNSSYRKRDDVLKQDEKAWDSGAAHPPMQPAVAQTCQGLRELALPIFYKENVFRACYCTRFRTIEGPVKWLRMIGPGNRNLLRHLYFYDRNPRYDIWRAKDLQKLRESDVFSEMDGKIENLSSKDCCAHLVTFGEWARKEGELPYASEEGVPRLRMLGEK